MKSIPPTVVNLYSGVRKLVISLTIVSLVFVTLFVVHSQNPANPTLRGQSGSVLLVPNQTVNAGEVSFRPDSDHDGMSDEDEANNGTDPDDPSDADADADGDGLSNGDEVAMGSGLNNADSDADGISDGEEARLGYNPNDSTNTPPVNATIVSIQVVPSPLELSLNAVLGAQPVQLQVNGTLNTGAIVDLTNTPGTTYLSLNTSVALVDGLGTAAPVTPGSTSITVQNGSFTVQVPVTVSTYTPFSIAEIPIAGFANSVAAQGTYAFVAAGVTGLQIVDVSSPRTPRVVGTFDTPGNANDVKVVGDFAYVADGEGLVIINVSNKNAPLAVGSVDTPGIAQGVAVAGTLAYIADGLTGLQIINVGNPAAPSLVGAVDTPGTARAVDVLGSLVAIADDSPANGLRVINVEQPQAPMLVGNLALTGQAKNVVVRESFAYVATNNAGLRVVSLATPSAPQLVGTVSNAAVRDVALAGNFAFGSFFVNFIGSPVIAINEPTNPAFRGAVNFADMPGGSGIAVAADQEYVYLTKQTTSGVAPDNGASGNTSLLIGRYQARYDRGGVPPSTSVITPHLGTTVIRGKVITLAADANDDVEVERVQFLVDDQVVATDRIVPYEVPYPVPATATSLTIRTIATDLNGASSSSVPITVAASSNPAPVVSLLSPQTGSLLIEGQVIELLAHASDDGEVNRIVFTAAGVALPADNDPPFRTTYTVPTGVSSLTISATATDDKGLSSTVTETFSVTSATTTTVTGRVMTSANQPVAGAAVSVFGEFFAQTITDGTFSLAGVPAVRGPISATASALIGSQQLSGSSFAVSPSPGGTTSVGNIVLQSMYYEADIGNLITFTGTNFNDLATAVTLPFSFTFYGVTYTQVFVGTNGYLTFGAGSTARNESPTSFANGLPRIAALFDDWAPEQVAGRGIFANTQLPGRVVFTWLNVENSVNHSNDEVSEEGNFQVILFEDGRIQFGYRRVETLGGLVGISPGGTPILFPLKHTALQGMNIGTTTAPYEQFLGIGDFPFDLQYAFITYAPNFGGYEIQVQRAPQTTVRGRLLDPNGSPAGGARVAALNRTVVSEADGSFNLEKVSAPEGPLVIRSLWVAPDGRLFQGQSPATQPLINGITDIGDLTLAARGEAFETDFGQLVPHASGGFPRAEFPLQFPFRFYGQSFYGQTVDRVYLYASGYLALTTLCAKSGCNDQFGLTSASVNDLIFSFSNTPIIAPLFSTLDPGNTGQVFVKSLPDKWVMTFVNVQQPGRPETNTFQVVLHADGTIRFAYNGIGNKHGHVGLSPGVFWGTPEDENYIVNWSTTPVRRMSNAYPFFEMFPGDFGGTTGNNFDLDRNVMVFFPNNDGSHEVIRQQFPAPAVASKIFFHSYADADVDLFSVNPDGSDRVNLTISRGEDYDPAVSPDGTRIAFDSYRDDPDNSIEEIYVMKVNGTALVRLTNNSADDFFPIWSPDGTKILFKSNRNGDYEIFIMNADGSGQRSLTGYAGDSNPAWSPDGTRILVTSDRDGVGGLYLMNADGSDVTHVDNTGTFGGNSDDFGVWSPDGSRIAFGSYRNGEGDIFIVNADGSGLINVTNHPSADFSPRWSPDGTRILFDSLRDGNFEVYVINAAGSGLVRLTNTPMHESAACWSPDGTQVAFITHGESDPSTFDLASSTLYIVNADGTATRTLVNNGALNFGLEWKTID